MTAAASTLAQRRATLKKLMADPEATFDQYRRKNGHPWHEP